jgi:polysaccharide deacetylase 2 family uncharacterized protein YibQ
LARKKRGKPRKSRRAPSRGFLIGIIVVITGIAVLIARTRAPMTTRASRPPAPAEAAEPKPLALESEWTRFRIRSESLYLRTLRAGDHAALLRLTSRTLRGALEAIGVDKDRIEEHVTAAPNGGNTNRPTVRGTAVNASAPPFAPTPPIQWHIDVPRRASLYRINDAITQAMDLLGGNVIRGSERAAPLAGVMLDLRVGYGTQVTHGITIQPNETMADPGAQIAFIVTDLDRSPLKLYRAFMKSPLLFSVALRPDGEAARVAKEVRQEHHEVLLHLPMEPKGYPRVDPGKDAILLDLSRIEIEDRITRCLSTIGPVQGVVSRLGSAALNDPDVMRAVLEELKRRDLPFIDAHTTGPSMVEEIGEETGARTLLSGGEIDDEKGTAASVRARIKELTAAAVQKGTLIVMVHPSPLVLDVLESEISKMKAQGLEMVPVSSATQ